MRLLRGLTGEVLTCGCLVGVYETYEGRVVVTIDARGASCPDPTHTRHAVVSRSNLQRRSAAEVEPRDAPVVARR
ncbi:MAG: hypothetical protein ABI634_13885 [Acidobacteriota bacterium]